MGFFSKLFNTPEGSTNNEEVLGNKCKVLIKVENITNKEITEKVSNLECLEGTEENIRLEFVDDGIIHIIHNDFGIIANVPVEKVNKTQKIIKENKRYAIRYELKYTKKSESVTLIMRLYDVMTAKEAKKIQQEKARKEKLKKQKANMKAKEHQRDYRRYGYYLPNKPFFRTTIYDLTKIGKQMGFDEVEGTENELTFIQKNNSIDVCHEELGKIGRIDIDDEVEYIDNLLNSGTDYVIRFYSGTFNRGIGYDSPDEPFVTLNFYEPIRKKPEQE